MHDVIDARLTYKEDVGTEMKLGVWSAKLERGSCTVNVKFYFDYELFFCRSHV